MFRALGVIFPARSWIEYDAFSLPFLGGGGRASGCDEADSVGEEGHAEGGAGVEVLADEEVAVVEGGGGERYDGLCS